MYLTHGAFEALGKLAVVLTELGVAPGFYRVVDAVLAAEVVAERSHPDNGWERYVQRLQELAVAAGKGMEVSPEAVLYVVAAEEADEGFDDGEIGELPDDAAIVLVEGRADTAEPRNQSRVAAVVMLQGLDGECDQSFCRGEVSEGITVLRWFDRGPWSFDAVDPAAAAGEGAGG